MVEPNCSRSRSRSQSPQFRRQKASQCLSRSPPLERQEPTQCLSRSPSLERQAPTQRLSRSPSLERPAPPRQRLSRSPSLESHASSNTAFKDKAFPMPEARKYTNSKLCCFKFFTKYCLIPCLPFLKQVTLRTVLLEKHF